MSQVHKRLTDEQIKFILKQYTLGILSRAGAEQALGVGKTRFFALLKEYRQDPEAFSISYQRATPSRLPVLTEEAIKTALQGERELVENPDLPISDYNYSAPQDRLQRQGINVSLTTIIERAKTFGCYRPHARRKAHDRQVLTSAIGALVQHDASTHLWSPFATEKWTLIASIDDYSRKLLYAEFFPQESSWAHIQAVQTLVQTYGLPMSYYVDSLRVFRFVQGRDSVWRKHVLGTDQADPQWRQVMRLLGIEVTYALSPQAKGKIERPFRWLQDRIVRTCALEKLATLDEVRPVLQEERERYNSRQVHSTTQEIPDLRFQRALETGNSLFRPYALPRPYASPDDVFCLREKRMVDGYRRISLFHQQIDVPHVLPHEEVEIHLVPDIPRGIMRIRLWWEGKLIHTLALPLQQFRVHF
jgi:hypothetical protein